MIDWLFAIIVGISVTNFVILYFIFYFVNRNWEHILDLKNHLNTLDKTIYYKYIKKD